MIRTVELRTMEDVFPLLCEQDYRPDLNRHRSTFVYRGMPDASFSLVTSLRRNCKDRIRQLEPAVLRNFTKYAMMDDPSIGRSVWRQMILGQHHGLPTRLLDWSHSPLIGLHFATSENNLDKMDRRDGVVWRIDMAELFHLLPERYQREAGENTVLFTVDMMNRLAADLDQYDRDMGDHAMVIVEPPSIDPRIVNQYAFFSVIPTDMTDIEGFLDRYTEHSVRYVIRRELRWRVRDMLDQQNISERIVYPGLDGLSRLLARHYYVR